MHPRRFRVALPRLLITILFIVSGACASLHAAPPRLAPAGYSALPLRRDARDQLLLPVRVGGKFGLFLVDTGSPHAVIDESRADFFGVRPVQPGDPFPNTVIANGRTHRIGVIPQMKAREVELRSVPAIVMDLRSVSSMDRRPGATMPDGIIGLDALQLLGAAVDCATPALLVRSPGVKGDSLREQLVRGGWAEIPLRLEASHLFVRGALNDQPGQFAIDTGTAYSVFERNYAARARLRLSREKYSSAALNFRDDATRLAKFRRLTLGGHSLESGRAIVFDLARLLKKSQWEQSVRLDGLIGVTTLTPARGIIDCANERLYLRGRKR